MLHKIYRSLKCVSMLDINQLIFLPIYLNLKAEILNASFTEADLFILLDNSKIKQKMTKT